MNTYTVVIMRGGYPVGTVQNVPERHTTKRVLAMYLEFCGVSHESRPEFTAKAITFLIRNFADMLPSFKDSGLPAN
jgi:hypothetical protein